MDVAADWTVITVTFDSRDDLLANWPADPRSRNFRWIVVDNGSTDGTVDLARVRADLVIANEDNRGFSAGNNCALPHVTTRFVAFANPDVRIDQSAWGELTRVASSTGGLVAPQLVNPDGSLQPNARGLPYLSSKILNRLSPRGARSAGYVAPQQLAEPTYCAWVMGAAVGGRTELLRELGGWDERYFLYYEDHDLGLRAWRCGYPVVIAPAARWTHGWARATASANMRAWGWELRSMRQFYFTYPFLLAPISPWKSKWMSMMARRTWRRVEAG